jgi:hypothetical protein
VQGSYLTGLDQKHIGLVVVLEKAQEPNLAHGFRTVKAHIGNGWFALAR